MTLKKAEMQSVGEMLITVTKLRLRGVEALLCRCYRNNNVLYMAENWKDSEFLPHRNAEMKMLSLVLSIIQYIHMSDMVQHLIFNLSGFIYWFKIKITFPRLRRGGRVGIKLRSWIWWHASKVSTYVVEARGLSWGVKDFLHQKNQLEGKELPLKISTENIL